MYTKIVNEMTLAVAVVLMAILCFDPFMVVMPEGFVYMVILGLVLFFSLFSVFVWKEKAYDEREQYHKMIAGRAAYLLGSGVLVLGIIVEVLTIHHVDKWLIASLLAMILGKLGAFIYTKKYK